MPVFWLDEENLVFPHPEMADKDGVLAVGGDLSPKRLLLAYQRGIFPWFNPDDPIIWWSPDPRFVLFPSELKVSRSMRPYFNQKKFTVSFDRQFEAVIFACKTHARGRRSGGTWITNEMMEAYIQLHRLGYAHSVEVWKGEELVGGLYGIALGKVFYGESMFSNESNASKFGFITLVGKLQEWGFGLVDCQQKTSYLAGLGARSIPRREFLNLLEKNAKEPITVGNWGDRLST